MSDPRELVEKMRAAALNQDMNRWRPDEMKLLGDAAAALAAALDRAAASERSREEYIEAFMAARDRAEKAEKALRELDGNLSECYLCDDPPPGERHEPGCLVAAVLSGLAPEEEEE